MSCRKTMLPCGSYPRMPYTARAHLAKLDAVVSSRLYSKNRHSLSRFQTATGKVFFTTQFEKKKYFVSMNLPHTSDDEMTLRSDHGYPCTSKPSKTAIVDSKQADADIVQVLMAPYRPAFRETKVDLMAGLCGHVFTARSALVGQLWSLGALSKTKGKDLFLRANLSVVFKSFKLPLAILHEMLALTGAQLLTESGGGIQPRRQSAGHASYRENCWLGKSWRVCGKRQRSTSLIRRRPPSKTTTRL